MSWSPTPETTTPSWRGTQQPWYPSRPNINVNTNPNINNIEDQMMKENTIDEPNQQGLGSKEGQSSANKMEFTLIISIISIINVINILAT